MVKGDNQKNWFVRHKILTAIIAVVVLGGIIGATGDSSKGDTDTKGTTQAEAASSENKAEVSKQEEKGIKGGEYKVGTDMKAGEYVIVGSGYLQISSDSTGKFESIIANDNYTNRTIVAVSDGQYIQFSGRAYTWEDAPKVDVSKGSLPDGRYKVGVDFPGGEYKVVPTGTGYLAVTSSASESIEATVTNDNFDSDKYVTVQDGQYIKLNRATLQLK